MVTIEAVEKHYLTLPEGEEKFFFIEYYGKKKNICNAIKARIYLVPYHGLINRALRRKETPQQVIKLIEKSFDERSLTNLLADLLVLPFDIVFSFSLSKHRFEILPETAFNDFDRLDDKNIIAAILGCYLRIKE